MGAVVTTHIYSCLPHPLAATQWGSSPLPARNPRVLRAYSSVKAVPGPLLARRQVMIQNLGHPVTWNGQNTALDLETICSPRLTMLNKNGGRVFWVLFFQFKRNAFNISPSRKTFVLYFS